MTSLSTVRLPQQQQQQFSQPRQLTQNSYPPYSSHHQHQSPRPSPNLGRQQHSSEYIRQLSPSKNVVNIDSSLSNKETTPPSFENPKPQTPLPNSESNSTILNPSHTSNGIAKEGETISEWGLTKAGKQRQRLPLACQVCRKKKIRCSGDQPVCRHCARFSLPCVYKTTTTRRPRNSSRNDSQNPTSGRRDRWSPVTSQSPQAQATSVASVQEREQPKPQPGQKAIPSKVNVSMPMAISISNSHQSLYTSNSNFEFSSMATQPQTRFLPHPPPPAFPRRESSNAISSSLDLSGNLTGPSSRKIERTSPSDLTTYQDNPVLLSVPTQTAPPSPTDSSSDSLPLYEITPLPSKPVLLHLVSIYFSHVNNHTYGFLHRPSFMRKLEQPSYGGIPPSLLYAICAMSARFSDQFLHTPQYDAGEPFAAEARRLALKNFDKPTVSNVQTLLLLALHDFGSKKGSKAWMFCGMAMRMAHGLRLNREYDGEAMGIGENGAKKGGPSWTEREVRRRTFWACFIMDRLNSTGMERPHVIQEEDCFVQLPTDERSFTFETPVRTERLFPENDSNFAAPEEFFTARYNTADPKHNMGSTAYLVRIVALWGRVTKYVNQGGRLIDRYAPWETQSGFIRLNNQLTGWLDSLPGWLKYSSQNLAAQVAINHAASFVFMHVAYHTVFCTLHRFAVPSKAMPVEGLGQGPESPRAPRGGRHVKVMPPDDFVQSSVRTCFAHAKAVSAIMADVMNRTDCTVAAPFLGFASFTANLFHLHQAFTPVPYDVGEDTMEARENFATGVRVLEQLRAWWGPLEMLYRSIRLLWQHKADQQGRSAPPHQIVGLGTISSDPTPQSQQPHIHQGAASESMIGVLESNDDIWLAVTPSATATGTTPQTYPIWLNSIPNTPGKALAHDNTETPSFDYVFDPTSLIPLPGGTFGFDFVDPGLYGAVTQENIPEMMLIERNNAASEEQGQEQSQEREQSHSQAQDNHAQMRHSLHNSYNGNGSGGSGSWVLDNWSPSTNVDWGGMMIQAGQSPSRANSPFRNALHGTWPQNTLVGDPPVSKHSENRVETTDQSNVLEQINKDENMVMPPPPTPGTANPTTPGKDGTTPDGVSNISISPPSIASSTGGSNWSSRIGGTVGTSSRKAHKNDEDIGLVDEAADLLVYFHARSGDNEANNDEDHRDPVTDNMDINEQAEMAGSKMENSENEDSRAARYEISSSNNEKQHEDKVSSTSTPNVRGNIGHESKREQAVRKSLYLNQTDPTGSLDLLGILGTREER